MVVSIDLVVNAILIGILLGGFYAVVAAGVTLSFGMLDIVNIAHPGFILLGAFLAYYLNVSFGLDPILFGFAATPVGFLLGRLVYRSYNYAFERRGQDAIQGLCFFFGLLFVIEIGLLLTFGVDYRFVDAPYITETLKFGIISIPMRLFLPMIVGVGVVGALYLFLSRTFMGRAILAVSQDPEALRFVGANPVHIKEITFGLSIAVGMLSGALLIIIQPIEPSLGRQFIGLIFAICVLGGVTSLMGTLAAAIILGVGETLTTTFIGASWSPAVAFTLLLITLAFRPQGIFGR